jgi:hypothetical protein
VPAWFTWRLLLLLVQAAICPAFVSRADGRKFLSCLLTVHPSMVQEMTSVIRNQVRACAQCMSINPCCMCGIVSQRGINASQ